MENYLGNKVSQEELLRHHARQRSRRQAHAAVMTSAQQHHQHQQMRRQPYSPMTPTGPDTPMSASDAALDEMIRSNNQEIEQIQRNNAEIQRRRRSLPQHYQGAMSQAEADRRSSMLEFANGDNSYQFGSLGNSPIDHLGSGFPNLSMNTNLTIPGTSASFSPQTMMADDFNMNSPEVMGNMGAFSNMNLAADPSMNFNSNMGGNFTSTPMNSMPSFGMDMGNDARGSAGMDSHDTEMMNTSPQFSATSQAPQQPNSFSLNAPLGGYNRISPAGPSRTSSSASVPSQQTQNTPSANTMESPAGYPSPHPATSTENSREASASSTQLSPANPPMGPPPPPKEHKTIYSKSGFDMLRALWQVATRKNPQVNLGAVDMSCAFVVCDVTMNDCPIIYVSDNFQNLTGYSQHDIIGQNCRFLQAPDGAVEAGTRREFVDNGAVYNLKQKIAEGKEVQQSLINYRKGGKPFLNLLTMIPIPWDTPEIRYIIGFQIDLVECPDAIASSQGPGTMKVNYKHSDIGQYIWTPPNSSQWEPENGQTLGVDDVSTLLQQFNPNGAVSDWHRQSWDKMILENTDDVVHVLSLKGLFLYLSPSAKRVLEYDSNELVGSSLSSICHPSDIVPVTRELKETTSGNSVNIVFRIRRKQSGYTWFESHGSLFIEQGKGRKCIILIGRKRPVFALSRRQLEANGGIGDSEMWTKLSTSGMFLFVSANVRSLLDLQPENLIGTSIQDLMRKESRPEFGRSIEKARRGRMVTCKHEVQNRRGQVLQAHTILYPGDASEGQKPTFLLAQTKLLKASSRAVAGVPPLVKQNSTSNSSFESKSTNMMQNSGMASEANPGVMSAAGGGGGGPGNQDSALASEDNIFDELKTTRCTSWQYELRQMEKVNRVLAEELHGLLSNKKKRKRRKGVGNVVRDCANCHTRNTPEWRRGPSGQRDLCNSCGLRWAKQTGRVSPRNSSRGGGGEGSKKSNSPVHSSPLHREVSTGETSEQPSESDTNTTANRSSSGSAMAGPGTTSTGTTPGAIAKGFTMPPLSQPLLEGGAAGSEMTAIQE